MIRYRLACEERHAFEAWFRSSEDCDAQLADSSLACPMCGSQQIDRALMAPAVAKGGDTPAPRTEPAAAAEAAEGAAAARPMLSGDPKVAEMVAALKELRDRLTAGSDNVGDRFPEEARKIHYGESEPRGIHGKASAEDAAALVEEGVQVMPLPVFPEDRN